MNTMEVLTLILVILSALSYIDSHINKKKKHPRLFAKDAFMPGLYSTFFNA